MKAFFLVLTIVGAVSAGACSAGGATSNVGTMDAPAVKACRDLRDLIQARAGGSITVTDLRARVAHIYESAAASANPIIKAKAVAVFADATEIASGGEGRSLSGDLTAMLQTCSAV